MHRLLFVLSFLLLGSGLLAQAPLLNLDDKGVQIDGYDPVAYFTLGKPTKGNESFKSNYNKSTYYFSSAENKTLFDTDLKTYRHP